MVFPYTSSTANSISSAASLPPHPYHRSGHPTSSPTDGVAKCSAVRRVILVLVSMLILFSCIISIAWLILKPRTPLFKVDSLNVSNFAVSESQKIIRGRFAIVILMTNPNKKMNLYFDNFDAFVSYRRTRLSMTSMKPLSLEKMERTSLTAELKANSHRCLKREELNDLDGKLRRGWVDFDVNMWVSTTFRAGNWLSMKRSMAVNCKNLKVIFSSSSKSTGMLEDQIIENCVVVYSSD
ncbi:hypothetical protein I3843_14G095500 [Carya illinoinensis]|uniref:Late embryogenesis abundant protein LEA-2 subgroup domain-containing protein n=1 Tax=Carya illinoinensis TaxID=32201 RepID=A0A922AH37_CARIL|nr:hypothetical protein I3760_14G097300 [Carya illinoinensis]KAG6678781.1 hypothetical protein I3842_14G097900 [Carya illinoinensis]KAG7947463.1 hypothetical protein I3843_14G095500 [Carya illinoinensis]